MPIQTTRTTPDYKYPDMELDKRSYPNVPVNGSPFGKGVQQAYGPDKLHGLAPSPQRRKKLPKQ